MDKLIVIAFNAYSQFGFGKVPSIKISGCQDHTVSQYVTVCQDHTVTYCETTAVAYF